MYVARREFAYTFYLFKMAKKKTLYILLILLTPFYFISCKREKSGIKSQCKEITYSYAKLLKRTDFQDYTKVEVKNPWDTLQTLKTYIISSKKRVCANGETFIKAPLSRSIVYTSPHCSLLNEIGAYNSIAGICDLQYINIRQIIEDCKLGKIENLGNGMQPDIEKIISINPDALLISPFENSGGHGQIEQLGIPIIECADYMENSPLGRSEWIKFYGLLFGKEKEADSLFSKIEKEYNEVKSQTSEKKQKIKVLCGLKAGAAWYVPGGKSLTAKLIADAGGNYAFADDNHEYAIPLPFETVFDKAYDSDIWIFTYNQTDNMTYTSLKKNNNLYSKFEAYKKNNIYGCNSRHCLYYEETPFHPEIVVKELSTLLGNNKESTDTLKYYKPLSK